MHTWGSKGSGEICYIKTWIFLFTKHVLRAWGHESNLDLYYLQYLSATFSQIQINIFCFSKWISRSHMRGVSFFKWHQYKPLKVYFWFITSKEVWLRTSWNWERMYYFWEKLCFSYKQSEVLTLPSLNHCTENTLRMEFSFSVTYLKLNLPLQVLLILCRTESPRVVS